ncbi:hypothetical protein HDV00_002692 [Rhizophlyctis rosea]|nr:hypothetical protein HDV00_002692 [Rhizophlyctis rosea]
MFTLHFPPGAITDFLTFMTLAWSYCVVLLFQLAAVVVKSTLSTCSRLSVDYPQEQSNLQSPTPDSLRDVEISQQDLQMAEAEYHGVSTKNEQERSKLEYARATVSELRGMTKVYRLWTERERERIKEAIREREEAEKTSFQLLKMVDAASLKRGVVGAAEQSPIFLLPSELFSSIARLCDSQTCRNLRNACRRTRQAIIKEDIAVVGAKERYGPGRPDPAWEWAVNNWHRNIVKGYMKTDLLSLRDSSIWMGVRVAALKGDEELLGPLIDRLFQIHHLHISNPKFREGLVKEAIRLGKYADVVLATRAWTNLYHARKFLEGYARLRR